jgi:hypothetical protein
MFNRTMLLTGKWHAMDENGHRTPITFHEDDTFSSSGGTGTWRIPEFSGAVSLDAHGYRASIKRAAGNTHRGIRWPTGHWPPRPGEEHKPVGPTYAVRYFLIRDAEELGFTMHSIQIVDRFHYNRQIVFGILVSAPDGTWPNVVGCSLRTRDRGIIDVPARWLESGGLALWPIDAPGQCINTPGVPQDGWSGEIIFALWPNAQFTHRIVDTGWVSWYAPWLVGSSTNSLDRQDEQVESLYGSRRKVWRPI